MATTLLEALIARANKEGIDKPRGFFNPSKNDYEIIRFSDLAKTAFGVGNLIAKNNPLGRKICVLMTTTPYSTIIGFYGAMSAGLTPVIVPSPKALSNREDINAKISQLYQNFGDTYGLIVDEQFNASLNEENTARKFDFVLPVTPENTIEKTPKPAVPPSTVKPSDYGFLQFTSASTGRSKAIAISHANIIANTIGIKDASGAGDSQIVVAWLPLYHDMGLIGTELLCLVNNYEAYHMAPFDFLKRPKRWLEAIYRFKGSLSPAPDFAYDYCCQLIDDAEVASLDLSTWKLAFNGAEPIQVKTLQRFIQKFSKIGYAASTFLPCYGLAEATLAVSFSPHDRVPKYLKIDQLSVGFDKKVAVFDEGLLTKQTDKAFDDGTYIISVGTPLPETEVWITGEDGNRVPEGICGEIMISGASIAQGYIFNHDEPIQAFPEGKLATGDLGFFYQGELYVLERIKNIIIKNGENYLASDLERQVSELVNIPFGKIAVFEADIVKKSSLIAIIELPSKVKVEDVERLLEQNAVSIDLPIDKFIITKVTTIPRTTSGKKKHYMCRNLYNGGKINVAKEVDLASLRK